MPDERREKGRSSALQKRRLKGQRSEAGCKEREGTKTVPGGQFPRSGRYGAPTLSGASEKKSLDHANGGGD